MRRCFDILVEIDAGASIEQASIETMMLATELKCTVKFKFNGVTCLAVPEGSPVYLEQNFHTELKSKKQFKIATSHQPQTPQP